MQHLVESMFAGVQALDVDAATASISDDIVLYDPHYPYPDMVGIAAVREGLTWAFTQMKSMRFDIERWFLDADGTSVVVETSTHQCCAWEASASTFRRCSSSTPTASASR